MKRSGTRPVFRSILCPIDFSDQSASALRYAAALARRGGGRLTALFVVDPRLIDAAASAYDERGLVRASRAQLERFVSASVSRGAAADVRCITSLGKPAEQILAMSKRIRAGLIVVGTHGLSGARKFFFGSTTEKLLRRSGVPVLAVPASCSSPPRGWPGQLMIAATDLDVDAKATLDAAALVARSFASPLLVVHVIPGLALPSWMHSNMEAHNRTRFDDARAQLAQLLTGASRGIPVEGRVLIGDPAESIAALAAEEHADLLMLPVSGRAGLLEPRHDATAYRVLCYAPAPLLTLPDVFTRVKRRAR